MVVSGLPALALVKIAGAGVALALSPIPTLIALVLLIDNARPRASSIAYLLGRASALVLLVVLFGRVLRPDDTLHRALSVWTHWAAVAIGAGLVAGGVVIWRRTDTRSSVTGRRAIGGIPPSVSASLGLLPPLVNPKVLAASIAAGSEIGKQSSNLAAAEGLLTYVTVATSTVAVPIAVYLVLGDRIDSRLRTIRQWLQRHQNTATAITLVVIGLIVLVYGLH